jgi:hypothetical protein
VRWVFYRLGGEQRTKEEGRWRDIQNVGWSLIQWSLVSDWSSLLHGFHLSGRRSVVDVQVCVCVCVRAYMCECVHVCMCVSEQGLSCCQWATEIISRTDTVKQSSPDPEWKSTSWHGDGSFGWDHDTDSGASRTQH